MPEPLDEKTLPTFGLVLGNDELSRLAEMVPPSDGKSYYVPAHLTRGPDTYRVDVRYRGRRHWNWNHAQKSWKVRMRPGALIDGRATFSFLNTPEPMPFDEQLILDVAREHGLLTPDYFPCRLLLNRTYMGVYFFETQPDEGLLRQSRRVAGSIYSGSQAPVDPKTGVSLLWKSSKHWKKVAASDPRHEQDFSELDALIEAVNQASPQAFADFAEHHLDLKKLALFDALDVVFGGNNHDFDQNHKLYFDPYRGRFEPIAWDYRGTQHQRVFNRTDNPLLLRLKQLPEYVTVRNRTVYDLLRDSCSPASMRARTRALLARLSTDQTRDPYWDAYHLLPSVNTYYRQLLRPMSRERQAEAAEARWREHDKRAEYLHGMLSSQKLGASLTALKPSAEPVDDSAAGAAFAIDLSVGGVSGYRLVAVSPSWPQQCQPAAWSLYADTNLSGQLEPAEDRKLGPALPPQERARPSLEVYPGMRLVARTPHPRRGAVRAVDEPRHYRLFGTTAGCLPTEVTLGAVSLVTGKAFQIRAAAEQQTAPQQNQAHSCPDGAPELVAGERSPHPWCYRRQLPTVIHLGPGEVDVPETHVFEKDQAVVIAPGTTLRLAPRASIIFLGRVEAKGTAEAPIRFEPTHSHWGGVALHGPGTAGCRLAYVELDRGTRPDFSPASFPGMLSVHDSADIEISHAAFTQNQESDDALHVAYVQDFRLTDALFRNAPADAVDLELSTATLKRLTVVNAGDECVDLMGSRVLLQDARLLRWGGSAVSAGEQTEAVLRDSLLARGREGVLVRNASTVLLEDVLFYRNAVGVRIEQQSPAYPGKSQVRGPVLHAVQCGQQVETPGRRLKTVGRIETELLPGELEPLRSRVLGLASWTGLDAELDRLVGKEGP
jgi:hypothetical protein